MTKANSSCCSFPLTPIAIQYEAKVYNFTFKCSPRVRVKSDYKIDICCFSAKHAALRRKNKTGWLGIAVHLGIIRTTSLRENTTTNVDENIKKARRSAYGLFSSGFHGYKDLDVDTMLHLNKIYTIPVLLYGLELILPKGPQLDQLEIAGYSSKYWHSLTVWRT